MNIEIERKFLISNPEWKIAAGVTDAGVLYQLGYLSTQDNSTVRVRTAGDLGYLTIKGSTIGISRSEFEYEIPYADAVVLLRDFCKNKIIKKRYKVPYEGPITQSKNIWEVDEFLEENQGLIIAEIELESKHQSFSLPPWIGKEVSFDTRYYNSNLACNPYSAWGIKTQQ